MKFSIVFNKKEIGSITAKDADDANEILTIYKKFGCFHKDSLLSYSGSDGVHVLQNQTA